MNPTKLWAEGYRTFDTLQLDLPHGCCAIVGENGAGKSSIINVIDVGLFAEPGELNDLLATDQDALELGLELEHGGETYRIRRQLRRGKSATVDFEQFLDSDPEDNWIPLTRETAKATNALICETIGLSRLTFRASAFLKQFDSAAFTEAAPRDRKAILAEILQLERWEQRREQASLRARGHDTELSRLEGRAEVAELTAKQHDDIERALEELRRHEIGGVELVDRAEQAVEQAQARLAETAAGKERVRACEAELATARSDEHRARDLLLEAQQADVARAGKQEELEQLAELASRVPDLQGNLDEQRRLQTDARAAQEAKTAALAEFAQQTAATERASKECVALFAQHEELEARLDPLVGATAGTERCDRCEQILGAEAQTAAIASIERDLVKLEAQITAKEKEAAATDELAIVAQERAGAIAIPAVPGGDFEGDLARARDAAARRDGVYQLIQTLQTKVVRLPLLQTELEQLAAVTAAKQATLDEAKIALGGSAVGEREIIDLRISLTAARTALDELRRQLAQHEAQLELVTAAEQELAEITVARTKLQAELDRQKLAQIAFGRDGIPALIVEAVAVPQLEQEANLILDELGTPFRVELRTQAENKSNDNIRETLDIVVSDGTYERDYSTYSGGERARLNLALRLALASLLAHRRGAESRILCIDELDGLDAAGMERLAGVLVRLEAVFDRILLVSHQADLANAFEQTLTVEKTDDRSHIVGAAAEAVPA